MTTLSPTERAVIRHLSLSEPMTTGQLAKVLESGLSRHDIGLAVTALWNAGNVTLVRRRNERGQLLGSGYILTPAGADLCEAMERERAELNAIAAQATREHGEPDGDALIAQAMQSPRFFSPPVKPSLWARVKAAFRRAA